MRFVGIDLSTKTGLVILDEFGEVHTAKEITSKIKTDPERMIDLTEKVMSHVNDNDIIAIEGFSYGSRGRGIGFQFGYGYAVRTAMYTADRQYLIVTPSQVKKYATGKGNTSKDNMAVPIFKKWEFEHESDNVRDAYVLAQIAYAMHNETETTKYQREIISDLKK